MKVSKKQIAKWQEQDRKRSEGHVANNLEQAGWVRDRKTGEWYDPKAKFEELKQQPWFQDQMRRMKDR